MDIRADELPRRSRLYLFRMSKALIPSAYRRESDDVFYTVEHVTFADARTISFLKEKAATSPRHRCRLCAHRDSQGRFQDMLIVLAHSAYVAPHKHLDRDESLHVIEGSARLYLFDDEGNISEVRELGQADLDATFFVRIPAGQYHTLAVTSPWFVFHEATTGPFNPNASLAARWAPRADEPQAVLRFVDGLAKLASIPK